MKKILFLITMLFLLFSCKTPEKPQENQVQPIPNPPAVQNKPKTEYDRAINTLTQGSVTVDAFEADRKLIMGAISELGAVMIARDFRKWENFISQDSIKYWSNARNLALVSLRLPGKNKEVKSLLDYFFNVFIPSRENKKIDEIRYISPTMVKAVQVTDNQDIVYYTFVKQNDKWVIYLDTLE